MEDEGCGRLRCLRPLRFTLLGKQVVLDHRVIIVVCAMLASLTCGTPNAFLLINDNIRVGLQLESYQINLIQSFGLVGLFFTLPVGFFNDRLGPFVTSVPCVVMSVLGYLAMSFTTQSTWYLMMLAFTLVGFGSGGVFICSLATGMKCLGKYAGIAVALVGGCMSLSMAITTGIYKVFSSTTPCDTTEDEFCWRGYLRTLAIVIAVVQSPTILGFLLLSKPKAEPIEIRDDLDKFEKTEQPVKIIDSLAILKNVFFLLLSLAYMAGIGGGLLVISQLNIIWSYYASVDNQGWVPAISACFSVANALLGGVGSGVLSDYLFTKKNVQRKDVLAVIFMVFSLVFYVTAIVDAVPPPISQENTGLQVLLMLLLISIGILFGSCFTLFPSIVGELYGYLNFGVFFGYLQISSAVSTFLVPFLAGLDGNNRFTYSLMFSAFAVLLGGTGVSIFFKTPTEFRKSY